MTYTQRLQVAYAVAALTTTVAYAVWLGFALADTAAGDLDYRTPLLIAIGASIVINALGRGHATFVSRHEPVVDQRDQQINQWGDATSFYVFSGLAALPLIAGIAGASAFWITHGLYFAFAITAVFGVVAKSVRYAKGA